MKKILERVIAEVIDHKAEGDLILSTAKSLKLSSQRGAVSEYKISSSQILGVRVIKDDRVGIAYTEATDDESLRFMIKKALQNSEITEPNPDERLLKLSGDLLDDVSYDEAPVDIALKTRKAIELETRVRELDPRVVAVPYNSFNENEYHSLYLSSRGRFTSYSDKSYSITSSALLDDNGKKANFYDFHLAHRFKDLKWDKVTQTALLHAKNLLGETTLPTGRYHVRFTPDCLKSLFDCFGNFYSAKCAIDKVNPWADQLGQVVAAPDLTITDDPNPGGCFRHSRFDDEGVEKKALTLVKDGVLSSLIHNSVTAKKLGTQTTGHASRGPTTSMNVSGTHYVIQGKNHRPLPDRYLQVIQMDGLYSGANRVSGTFSVAVKGYLWENGERKLTFGNVTLSGNFLELLRNVEVAGEKLEASTDESFFSVPLIFGGLSIAGA